MLPKKMPRYNVIVTIVILVSLVTVLTIVVVHYDAIVNNVKQMSVIRPILLFTSPTQVNLTIEGNSTVSKRISLSFSDVVNLLPPKLDLPLSNQSNGTNLSSNLLLIYDNSSQTSQYYVYIVANNSEVSNNSKATFSEGSYEGIIRFYYKDYRDATGKVLNKAIPFDLKVVNNTKND